jgi:opacity protein-like surface antigen
MLMKKALLIVLALGLICAWSVPARAIDWTAFGGFTVESAFYKNIDNRFPVFLGGVPGSNRFLGLTSFPPLGFVTTGPAFGLAGAADPAWNRQNWWLQMRGDIYILARASADLQEVNSARFGDADPKFIPFSGTSGLGSGIAGRWNADAIAIQVKSMYIDFKVPAIPNPVSMRVKVGIQPYQLRNPVFLYVDAAGITANLAIPAGDYLFNINPFWAVINHGTASLLGGTVNVPTDWTTADDGNFFGVDINAVIGNIKPGIFFAMERQSQIYQTLGEGNKNLWWIGPYVDATFGPVALTLDFVYNGGYDQWDSGAIEIVDPANPLPLGIATVLGNSRRHEAWLARGVASYTMNKFKFGVGALYGTGDNPGTPDKYEGYMVPYRSEAAKFNDDFLVLTGDWGLRQPFGVQNIGGLYRDWASPGQGVWYVRGFADYAVNDWLKLKVNGGYIGDTVRHGDEFGTDFDDDHTVGWEFDAGVQINIYQNLFLDSAFGYLIGGKALASQFLGDRAQDPWTWITSLTYMF